MSQPHSLPPFFGILLQLTAPEERTRDIFRSGFGAGQGGCSGKGRTNGRGAGGGGGGVHPGERLRDLPGRLGSPFPGAHSASYGQIILDFPVAVILR